MPGKRIVVSGIGIVCALGRDRHVVWKSLMEGRCGIGKLDRFRAPGCLSEAAAQTGDIDPPEEMSRIERRRATRTDRLCLRAAEEAVAQAWLSALPDRSGLGVSLGSSTAGMLETEAYCRSGLSRGFDRAAPSRVLGLPSSAPTDAVARHFGAGGPRVSNMTACASSAASIGFAADLIRSGDATAMIAGGGDALCLMTYAGFNALRLLDPDPCRPFASDRAGLTLGEGAGILILEERDRALARGAEPLAEFMDYGSSCDAHHMTAPHPEGRGAARAMAEALDRSGLAASGIDHINAHGTGTPANDASEATAIRLVFGKDGSPAVAATKASHGHLLGGAGAVEAAILVLCLVNKTIPAMPGTFQDDTLDLVAGEPRRLGMEHAITNSFGFGGTNVALVFGRP
jgi:3-oxoacyl-[acyl-carrier-protein] synthase II